ncbi:hypothetical protein NIES298_05060 [Microcystis aeruginosa NIES-298]|nr:hypothetical protein NIES298_05060 [Microcystis aeruginosa NIES-298]
MRCWGDCVTLFLFFSRPKAGRFCRGELRSPTGNNRPTGNYRPTRFLGIWGDFWVIWAQAMRPYGVLGEFGFFGVFWGYLGARDAPLRVFGGIWVFWGFWGVGRTRCAPTGFWWNLGFLGFLGGWAHAMRPYGFLGFFGVIWAHAMRPYGFWTQRKAKNPRIKLI